MSYKFISPQNLNKKSFNKLKDEIFKKLLISTENTGCFDGDWKSNGKPVQAISPIDGSLLSVIRTASFSNTEQAINRTKEAWKKWNEVPVPKRGEIVRSIGQKFRHFKEDLGTLISIEVGKIKTEGLGEVQEIIDICDFACGLSRNLEGKVIPSERNSHVIYDIWNPLGTTEIISAFNFPAAVFGWNMALNLICGNTQIWKGSPTTNLTTIACTKIIESVLKSYELDPAICSMVCGDETIGDLIVKNDDIDLISFTGSTKSGRSVSTAVSQRFGRCILELGGNNALIAMNDSDLQTLIPSVVFGFIGTTGQRCTSTRRLFVHELIYEKVVEKLLDYLKRIKIGHPLIDGVHCGPLHSQFSVDTYKNVIQTIKQKNGKVLLGGEAIESEGFYIEPTIVEGLSHQDSLVKEETFAPILYIFKFKDINEAILMNNSVKQGLSSSLFSSNICNLYKWIGPNGSDCGIVNFNTTTNGAEIGGPFGGNKHTGWGRESGGDAWKQYVRRSTCTINYGKKLEFSQGVKFD